VKVYNKKVDELTRRGENSHRLMKVDKRKDNKGTFDYFTNPELAQKVTKKLGYDISDFNEKKQQKQDSFLDNLRSEWNKCQNMLSHETSKLDRLR
jgi:tetrahydromethanopterin S-methyltransferase subunit G